MSVLQISDSSATVSAAFCATSTCNIQLNTSSTIDCIDCSNLVHDESGIVDVNHVHLCFEKEVGSYIQEDNTIAAYIETAVEHFHAVFTRLLSQAYSTIWNEPLKCAYHNIPPISESSFILVSMLLRWCRSWKGFGDHADQLLHLYAVYVEPYNQRAHNHLQKYFSILLSINTTSNSSDSSVFMSRKDATEKIFTVLEYFFKLRRASSITSSGADGP